MSEELNFDGYSLTEKEKKRYRELQRKVRAHNRAVNKFWKDVDNNREAVIEHLCLDIPQPEIKQNPLLEKALSIYGCNEDEFFKYVLSDSFRNSFTANLEKKEKEKNQDVESELDVELQDEVDHEAPIKPITHKRKRSKKNKK